MGEKIRDLHSVKIGSAELMVELNEGNTKGEGRLIHVQNKHFRFLIGEKGFLELAATILRAYSEMQYYKTTGWKKHPVNTAEVEKWMKRHFMSGNRWLKRCRRRESITGL